MAAYNLYRGNGSRAERVDDRRRERTPARPQKPQSPQHRPPSAPPCGKQPILRALPKNLGAQETAAHALNKDLYLMYRESGDRELLIIMGAMYLL